MQIEPVEPSVAAGAAAWIHRMDPWLRLGVEEAALRSAIGARPVDLHLKALEALGGNPHDGAKVVAKMKTIPTDDPLFGKGEVEANGRVTHDAYLFEVKKPSESKGPWDYYKLVATIPADEAFRPLAESACPLVKK